MEPGKPTNFEGRFGYLTATQKYWPELLASLRENVSPAYERYQKAYPGLSFADRFRDFSEADGKPRRGAEELHAAVESWKASHEIKDEWLLDAAVQTLWAWAKGAPNGKWLYGEPELKLPTFEAKFDRLWIPELMLWKEFNKDIDRQYREQLLAYRKEIETLWGTRQRSVGSHAIWTVLWQRGMSPKAIRQRYYEETKQDVSFSNIQMRVSEFAASIGLSLRKPKTHSSKIVQP